ncbi:flippase-like domain-containing protein [Candidatus Bipolaricaulota bacterium]|nr:flippase-like domain-containing protein [Candidatus Bipolaricaulota bacterium]
MGPSLAQGKRYPRIAWDRVRAWASLSDVYLRSILGERRRGFIISTLFGIALMIIMVWIARPMDVLARISALRTAGIIAFVSTIIVGFSFGVEGWRTLLRSYGVKRSFPQTFAMMSGAYAVTFFTPSFHLGGEPVRAFAASDGFTRRSHEVIATILIERLIYLIIIATLLLAGGSIGLGRSSIPIVIQQGILAVAGAGLVAGAIVLVGMSRKATWASRTVTFILRHLPQWAWVKRVRDGLQQVEREVNEAFVSHRRDVLVSTLLFTLSVGMNLLAPLVFLSFAYGRFLSIEQLLIFFTLSTGFSLFSWLTPGGVGIMEGAYAGIFSIMGLPIDGAIAFSLLQKLSSLCIVAVGIIYLGQHGIGLLGKKDLTEGQNDK